MSFTQTADGEDCLGSDANGQLQILSTIEDISTSNKKTGNIKTDWSISIPQNVLSEGNET